MTEVHAVFGARRSGKTFAAATALNRLIDREGAPRILLVSPVEQNKALMFRALHDTASPNNLPNLRGNPDVIEWPSGAKAKYVAPLRDLRGMYADYMWLDGRAIMKDLFREVYRNNLDRTLKKIVISGNEPDELGAYWLIDQNNQGAEPLTTYI